MLSRYYVVVPLLLWGVWKCTVPAGDAATSENKNPYENENKGDGDGGGGGSGGSSSKADASSRQHRARAIFGSLVLLFLASFVSGAVLTESNQSLAW